MSIQHTSVTVWLLHNSTEKHHIGVTWPEREHYIKGILHIRNFEVKAHDKDYPWLNVTNPEVRDMTFENLYIFIQWPQAHLWLYSKYWKPIMWWIVKKKISLKWTEFDSIDRVRFGHWNPRVVSIPTLSSLVAQGVVMTTTSSTASDEKVGIVVTLSFQWLRKALGETVRWLQLQQSSTWPRRRKRGKMWSLCTTRISCTILLGYIRILDFHFRIVLVLLKALFDFHTM